MDPLQRYPRYPWPWKIALEILLSLVRNQPRSFRSDALRCLSLADFPLEVAARHNIPQNGPAVIVVNHYSRPGFRAWWIALTISALVPTEMHWTMTSAWTSDGSIPSYLLAIISYRLFPRLARLYGFTAMPPMPPRPFEAGARAHAVRRVLAAARSQPPPIFGFAPEGQDTPGGALMRPHSGVGRFLLLLSSMGYPLYPVGVYEADGAMCLNFGAPFALAVPERQSADEADRLASEQVMRALACQLPTTLRGEFN